MEGVFEPVRPPTTFEETVERLGTAIRLGLLPPGSRLPPEREPGGPAGISRSTLRQALTTLVQSGHLVSLARPQREARSWPSEPPLAGARREVLGEEARAVLDYRVAVETGAAVLAAERAGADDLDRLRICSRADGAAHRSSRTTGAPTSASTSAWPRPARSPRLVAR